MPEIQRTVQPPYFTRANVLESFRISRNGYCNHILQRITLIRLIMRRVGMREDELNYERISKRDPIITEYVRNYKD